MTSLKLMLCAGAVFLGMASAGAAMADDQATPAAPAAAPAAAAPAAPTPSPAPYPSFGPTISANGFPATFDAGPLGKLTVNGVLSGIGYVQEHPGIDGFTGNTNPSDEFDASNAMVTLQKTDGVLQFAIQAGAYSFPALGAPYIKASEQANATFGVVPVAFIKIVPNAMFSFQIGQLPTLIGAELPFTYQNANIERGLLWNVEPLISRGIQGNFTNGPWAVSVSWNDGDYSNEYSTISGLVTYTFKNSDTLTFAGAGNTDVNFKNCGGGCAPFATPVGLNEGSIFNLIFTHTQGPWTITPYIQYSNVPRDVITGASGQLWGFSVIGKYSFTPEFALAARAEYEGSTGAFNTLYGPHSNAYSFTVTPTYTKGIFFARIEGSYTAISSGTPGFELGSNFVNTNQFKGMLELGLNF